jgi:hypothetical protein
MYWWLYSIFLNLFRASTGTNLNRKVTILPYYRNGNKFNMIVIRDDNRIINSLGSTVYGVFPNGDIIDITQEPGVEYNFAPNDIGASKILVRNNNGDRIFYHNDKIVFD